MKARITNGILNMGKVTWDVHEHVMNTDQPINSSGSSQCIFTTIECARLLSFVIPGIGVLETSKRAVKKSKVPPWRSSQRVRFFGSRQLLGRT